MPVGLCEKVSFPRKSPGGILVKEEREQTMNKSLQDRSAFYDEAEIAGLLMSESSWFLVLHRAKACPPSLGALVWMQQQLPLTLKT